MKSLEIIKEVEEDVRKYGIVNNLSFTLGKIIQIERDLEVLEIIKKCRFVGCQKYAGNTLVIDNMTDEQYQEIKEWIEENEK